MARVRASAIAMVKVAMVRARIRTMASIRARSMD